MLKKRLINCLLFIFILLGFFNIFINNSSKSNILSAETTLKNFQNLSVDEVKNYYSSLSTGDKGNELLAKLQDILKDGQVKLNYNSGNTSSDNWDGYYLLDRDWSLSPLEESEISTNTYKRSGIWMRVLYSSQSIYVEDGINSGKFGYYDNDGNYQTISYKNGKTQFDREHVFPKSFGFNADGEGYKKLTAGCDMQNLHAGEHNGNSAGHNNYPFGNVETHDSSTQIVSGITGEVIGYLGENKNDIKVFEPLDSDKGDIARTIFYMCARYHSYEELGGGDNTPALTLSNAAESGSTLSPENTIEVPATYGELDDLLAWNVLDPVDDYEIKRNNLCHLLVQGNRNPFIDYPSWADVAFTSSEVGIDLSAPDGLQGGCKLEVVTNVASIYSKSNLDLTQFTYNFTDDENNTTSLLLSDLSYQVLLDGSKQTVDDLTTYQFIKPGNYDIIFSYLFPKNSQVYTCTYRLKVNNSYEIKIENMDDVISKYDLFSSLDLNNIELFKYYRGTKETIFDTGYSIRIYHNGNLLSDDNTYRFTRLGKYEVFIDGEIDGEEVVTSFILTVSLSTLQLIIVCAILLVIIVLIIIVYNSLSKKNKKQLKKYYQKQKSYYKKANGNKK